MANIREFSLFPLIFCFKRRIQRTSEQERGERGERCYSFYKSRAAAAPGFPILTIGEKPRRSFRTLLSQPDLPSFVSAWSKETELQHRVLRADAETYQKS